MLLTGIRCTAALAAAWSVAVFAAPATAVPPESPVYELSVQSPPGAYWAFAETPNIAIVGEPGAPGASAWMDLGVPSIKPSDYYIGLGCTPAPEMLRAHLGLKEGQGLVVEQVLPNSPAATAKLQRFDVLVRAGDKPLGSVQDLVSAVDAAKDKKFSLELYRQGKSMKVDVTPMRRPAEMTFRVEKLPGTSDLRARIDDNAAKVEAEVRKAIEEAKKAGGALPNIVIREFHPGILLPPGSPNVAALPGNMSVSVTKKGNEPAKIVVTRDDKKWEIAENELDKLPADVRPMVENTLRGLSTRARGLAWAYSGAKPSPSPVVPPRAVAPRATPPKISPPKDREEIQKKLDQLDQKLDELRKSLDQLRSSQAGKGSHADQGDKK